MHSSFCRRATDCLGGRSIDSNIDVAEQCMDYNAVCVARFDSTPPHRKKYGAVTNSTWETRYKYKMSVNCSIRCRAEEHWGEFLESLAFLHADTHLDHLYLNTNRLTSLHELAPLQQLHHLSVALNRVASLHSLPLLPHLTRLYISENLLTSLEGIERITTLHVLHCGNNRISCLRPLETLTALQDLSFKCCEVDDLSPLRSLPELRQIDGSYNRNLTSLRGIEKCKYLWAISFKGGYVKSLEYLEHLDGKKTCLLFFPSWDSRFCQTMMTDRWAQSRNVVIKTLYEIFITLRTLVPPYVLMEIFEYCCDRVHWMHFRFGWRMQHLVLMDRHVKRLSFDRETAQTLKKKFDSDQHN